MAKFYHLVVCLVSYAIEKFTGASASSIHRVKHERVGVDKNSVHIPLTGVIPFHIQSGSYLNSLSCHYSLRFGSSKLFVGN